MRGRHWVGATDRMTAEDRDKAQAIIGSRREPDLVIAPDGRPYLYRWHLVPYELKNEGGVFFHVQVNSDPERPLHDHPWDNQSVILSGGYDEIWNPQPWLNYGYHDIEEHAVTRKLRKGSVTHRHASEAHRLILPKDMPYTMTLFSVGPVLRNWGFWTEQGWLGHEVLTTMTADGRSIFREVEYAKAE